MRMIEDIWLETDGATGQFHETKLTMRHFNKNAYSRMNVSLAAQLLSSSVMHMILSTIVDEEVLTTKSFTIILLSYTRN